MAEACLRCGETPDNPAPEGRCNVCGDGTGARFKRALRKTIWIQPHVRFKDESFPTLGREIEAQEPTR